MVIGDKSTHIKNSSLDFLELELRFFGAHITKSWSSDVSHVMCDKRYHGNSLYLYIICQEKRWFQFLNSIPGYVLLGVFIQITNLGWLLFYQLFTFKLSLKMALVKILLSFSNIFSKLLGSLKSNIALSISDFQCRVSTSGLYILTDKRKATSKFKVMFYKCLYIR